MTIVKEPNKIACFFTYYADVENVHMRIQHLFRNLSERHLLSNIQIAIGLTEERTKRDVTIYPNGMIFWYEKPMSGNDVEACLTYIEREGKNNAVTLRLHLGIEDKQEKRKQKLLKEQVTIGQYAIAIRQMEREEQKELEELGHWEQLAKQRKQEKMDSLFDRYNIQKTLYELFGDPKYLRRMNRWMRIASKLNQLWSDEF